MLISLISEITDSRIVVFMDPSLLEGVGTDKKIKLDLQTTSSKE